jgi:hypothetical protein
VWAAPVAMITSWRDPAGMTITQNTSQRDLVRLALLMCGDRPGAKFAKPVKGVQGSRNIAPTRGYSR